MSRYWLGRSAGSWTIRLAVVLAAMALVVGLTAAHQRSLGGAAGRGAFTGTGLESVTRGKDQALEIRLDDLMTEIGSAGFSSLDREALLDMAQRALQTPGKEEPVELMRVADVLEGIPSVRILTEGRSVVLGPRAIRLLARLALDGQALTLDELTVGELLDALPPIALNKDGSPRRLDRRSEKLADAIFGGVRKVDHARAPGFSERLVLEQRYERVVELVEDLRRDGFTGDGDRNAVYDEAYNRLLTSNEENAIALLDGHLRLEEEIDNADMRSLSHAERIQFRWEARRLAFGDETAKMLFGRQEAMERYQVDKLALEADDYSAPGEKAKRLEKRRKDLKVELAAMGSYVGFPSASDREEATAAEPEAAAPADPEAAAPDEAKEGSRRRRTR